jgi:hypothetical protein
MAERNPRPANSAKIPWPSATYGTADPASQRAAGWAPNEVPASQEYNFLQKMWGEEFVWLASFAAREWADLYEGITNSSVRDIFRVMPADDISARGAQIFKVTGTITGSTGVSEICTDGLRIYYTAGGQYYAAASPADGSEIWESNDVGATNIFSLCTDGLWLYATCDSGTAGLQQVDPTEGDLNSSGGTTYGCSDLATNAVYVIGINPNGAVGGSIVFWSGIQGTIVEDGSYNTTSTQLNTVAIDKDQCYAGGVRATYDVWAVTLSTRAHAWRTVLPTSSAPTVHGIACDGNRVYVATDRVGLTAGGSANLHALDRITGAVLWSMDVTDVSGTALSLNRGLVTDGRYLYASDGTGDDCHIVDPTGPTPSHVGAVADLRVRVCDGVSVIGNSNLTTELKRVWMMDGVQTFRRTTGSDTERRPPYYTLATPANYRL